MKNAISKENPRSKTHLRRGDTVRVIAGREKGKEGKILQVFREHQAVSVERLNLVKKATKPNPKYPKGGIVEKEGLLPISNVMILCPKCDRPVRLAASLLANGEKLRVCRRCGDALSG